MVVSRPTKVQHFIAATYHPSATTRNLLLINSLQRLVAEWQQRGRIYLSSSARFSAIISSVTV